jgi:hypothetical protein
MVRAHPWAEQTLTSELAELTGAGFFRATLGLDQGSSTVAAGRAAEPRCRSLQERRMAAAPPRISMQSWNGDPAGAQREDHQPHGRSTRHDQRVLDGETIVVGFGGRATHLRWSSTQEVKRILPDTASGSRWTVSPEARPTWIRPSLAGSSPPTA